jgi:hypothetical protein
MTTSYNSLTNAPGSPRIAPGGPGNVNTAASQQTGSNELRALCTGFWLGLWVGAIGLAAWGVWYVTTHHNTGVNGAEWTPWVFWLYMIFAPLILVAMRFWKWIFTLALVALGGHHLHKLDATARLIELGGAGYLAYQNKDKVAGYGRWLTRSPQAPGASTQAERIMLRAALLCGIAFWCVMASCVYPKNGTTYSQSTPVIHSGCVDRLRKI